MYLPENLYHNLNIRITSFGNRWQSKIITAIVKIITAAEIHARDFFCLNMIEIPLI